MNETSEDVIELNQLAATIADYITTVGCWHASNGNWIFYRQELEHYFPFVDFSKRYSTIIDHIFTHLIKREGVLDVEIESDPDTDEFVCFDVIFGLDYCPHAESDDKEDDMVNHPSHYTQGGIECIDAIRAAVTGKPPYEAWLTGQVIKYVWRYNFKNGKQDLEKAEFCLKRLIDVQEKSNE